MKQKSGKFLKKVFEAAKLAYVAVLEFHGSFFGTHSTPSAPGNPKNFRLEGFEFPPDHSRG